MFPIDLYKKRWMNTCFSKPSPYTQVNHFISIQYKNKATTLPVQKAELVVWVYSHWQSSH